jgi:DegV family protein with EDD domain
VRIVTDSAARLPADWAAAHHVIVLPHYVVFEGRLLREDIDIQADALHAHARGTDAPFDVQPPSLDDFIAVYRELADAKADVISLHISAALSESVRIAQRAKDDVCGRCNIQIVDSRTIASGLNALVRMAVDLAEQGLPAELIVKRLRGAIQNIYAIFVSDDMRYLERSARLRPAQATLGRMLSIIPCLTMEEGDLVAVEKVRSAERAVEKLTEFASEFEPDADYAILQISPDANARTRELIEALLPQLPNARQIALESCGARVASIIGGSGIGIMIVEKF